MAQNKFEHTLLNKLNLYGIKHKKFLLGVSGGVDSMAMLEAFTRILPADQLRVAHFHHGQSASNEQMQYRNQAKDCVQHFCNNRNIQFNFEYSENDLSSDSEDFFRRQRLDFFNNFLQMEQILVLAHHREDLLETRLIRLFRGTGIDGLCAMQELSGTVLRPFLDHSKTELLKYCQDHKVEFVEDPSNLKSHYFRNWIRNELFPFISQKDKSHLNNLGRSLDLIVQALSQDKDPVRQVFVDNCLLRKDYFLLSIEDKKRAVALLLRKNNLNDWSFGYVNEVVKNLDSDKKKFQFSLGKNQFNVTLEVIQVKT